MKSCMPLRWTRTDLSLSFVKFNSAIFWTSTLPCGVTKVDPNLISSPRGLLVEGEEPLHEILVLGFGVVIAVRV